MSDFSYQPAFGAQVKRQPRALTAKFGDGYEQRVGDGINTNPQIWSLTFTRQTSDLDAIETLLSGYAGVTAFTWTPQGGSQITVVCREWLRGYNDKGTETLSTTFEQVFE